MIKHKLRYHASLRGTKCRSNHGFFEIASSRFALLAMTLLLSVVCGLWTSCLAQPVSSAELINNAKQYDGQEVVYRGEVVGELMRRPPHAWVNVFDGASAIGIWAEIPLIEGISYAGAYQTRGDIVEITGIFHRACLEHGGDLDIHARQIVLQEQGKKSLENPDENKKITAVLLLGVLILVWILHLLRRK